MHLRNRIEVCRVLVLIYRVPYTKGTKCIRRRYHVQIHRTNLPDKCRSPSLQSNSSSKLPCLISQSNFNWPKSNLQKIHVPDEVKLQKLKSRSHWTLFTTVLIWNLRVSIRPAPISPGAAYVRPSQLQACPSSSPTFQVLFTCRRHTTSPVPQPHGTHRNNHFFLSHISSREYLCPTPDIIITDLRQRL